MRLNYLNIAYRAVKIEQLLFSFRFVIASNNSLVVPLHKQTASDDSNNVLLLTHDMFEPIKQFT